MFQSIEREKRHAQAEAAVNSILDKFDFSRVQKGMEGLNWSYADGKCPPSIDQLKETARTILSDIAFSKFDFSKELGGFRATKYSNHISLAFEISEAHQEIGAGVEPTARIP